MVVVEIAIERCPIIRNWPNNRRGRCCLVGNWYPCSWKLDTRTYYCRCGSPDRRPSLSSGIPKGLPCSRPRPPAKIGSELTGFPEGIPLVRSPVVHAFLTSAAHSFPKSSNATNTDSSAGKSPSKTSKNASFKVNLSRRQQVNHIIIISQSSRCYDSTELPSRSDDATIFCLHSISTIKSLFAIRIIDINWWLIKISVKLGAKWWL